MARWLLNDGFRWKRSWLNRGSILAFAWRNWGNPCNISIRIAFILAEVWTEHLPNISLRATATLACSVLIMSWRRACDILFCILNDDVHNASLNRARLSLALSQICPSLTISFPWLQNVRKEDRFIIKVLFHIAMSQKEGRLQDFN
jgi:hypothetical protein